MIWMGLCLAWAYHRSERLVAPMMAHALHDALATVQLLALE